MSKRRTSAFRRFRHGIAQPTPNNRRSVWRVQAHGSGRECGARRIASGTVHALGGAVIMTLAYVRKIRLEEQNLRNVFGGAYDGYRKTTWAIIPGLM